MRRQRPSLSAPGAWRPSPGRGCAPIWDAHLDAATGLSLGPSPALPRSPHLGASGPSSGFQTLWSPLRHLPALCPTWCPHLSPDASRVSRRPIPNPPTPGGQPLWPRMLLPQRRALRVPRAPKACPPAPAGPPRPAVHLRLLHGAAAPRWELSAPGLRAGPLGARRAGHLSTGPPGGQDSALWPGRGPGLPLCSPRADISLH